ncbi:MAG: putative toxin-antitoxin system toxin component, PIN family [Burkholderiaceae bacterium]
MTEGTRSEPVAVLDTNVWLDWLVFDDIRVQQLKTSSIRFITCESMRAELAQVLCRPQFALNKAAQLNCLLNFDDRVHLLPLPAHSMTRLRCTDSDDQQFLELAVAGRANCLLTQDKALLKLAGRARREHQLDIATAEDWCRANPLLTQTRDITG